MTDSGAFSETSLNPAVRGYLHSPASANGDALILSHGAGGNCNAPLLVALAQAFSEQGWTVLRCDLPFRQDRPTGPPFPGNAERDRSGLRNAVAMSASLIMKNNPIARFGAPGMIFIST